jgi:WD40 repeat protein
MDYNLCRSVVTSFEQEKSAVLGEEYYDACYVLACKASPDQTMMVSILSDNTVNVYETGVGSTQGLRSRGSIPNAHQGRVNDLAMLPQHPDGSVFITAGQDGGIRTWDLRESYEQPSAERKLTVSIIFAFYHGCTCMPSSRGILTT